MVTSEVPATTLVFLGGMMMVGAMGSAGPPTSGERSGVSWDKGQKSEAGSTGALSSGVSRWSQGSLLHSPRAESPDADPRVPLTCPPLLMVSSQCPGRPPSLPHSCNTTMPSLHCPVLFCFVFFLQNPFLYLHLSSWLTYSFLIFSTRIQTPCMGLMASPKLMFTAALTMTLFGNRVFADIIRLR